MPFETAPRDCGVHVARPTDYFGMRFSSTPRGARLARRMIRGEDGLDDEV
ncbi:hypothetical protein [Streptomyces sp. NPDC005548]